MSNSGPETVDTLSVEDRATQDVADILQKLKELDGHEPEFLEAAKEILDSLVPVIRKSPKYLPALRAMVEPERLISFRVVWTDDQGREQVNRGWRCQFSSVLGPYKGGMRFHPSVNQSILKFLGFEQIFKNSLTGLQLGGGKGGSNFDPKGKSDGEVKRFCGALMSELHRYLGPDQDVPAGDIGVGAREVNYMYGAYRKCKNRFEPGVLTGKHMGFGGSNLRPEATGYGVCYFLREVYNLLGIDCAGQRAMVTGSGNVALFCIQKLLQLGFVPITCSDSNGTLYVAEGINEKMLKAIRELKEVKRGRLSELDFGVYHPVTPTARSATDLLGDQIPTCDVVLPCATQNEVDVEQAKKICQAGVKAYVEGANMPTTNAGIDIIFNHPVLYGPAKAANAGGVAVSGLEMAQNASKAKWTPEDVDQELQKIMKNIFQDCLTQGARYTGNERNLKDGANIAGFVRVADAMLAQGFF